MDYGKFQNLCKYLGDQEFDEEDRWKSLKYITVANETIPGFDFQRYLREHRIFLLKNSDIGPGFVILDSQYSDMGVVNINDPTITFIPLDSVNTVTFMVTKELAEGALDITIEEIVSDITEETYDIPVSIKFTNSMYYFKPEETLSFPVIFSRPITSDNYDILYFDELGNELDSKPTGLGSYKVVIECKDGYIGSASTKFEIQHDLVNPNQQFIVSFNSGEEGSLVRPMSAKYGANIELPIPTHPKEDDKLVSFIGWSLEVPDKIFDKDTELEELPDLVGTYLLVLGNTKLYAVWGYDEDDTSIPDVLECSITLDAKNDTENKTIIMRKGNVYRVDSLPDHDNVDGTFVTFIGWSLIDFDTIFDKDGDLESIIDDIHFIGDKITVNNNIILYAVWGYDENTDGVPDILEDKFTLYFGEPLGLDPINLLDDTTIYLDNLNIPTHEDEEGVPVVFIGWIDEAPEKIFSKDDDEGDLPTLIEEIEIDLTVSTEITLYPVWGYDENKNASPDVLEDKFTLSFDESLDWDPITNILNGTIFDLTGLESPEHEDVGDIPVLFVGWSLTEATDIATKDDDIENLDIITELEIDIGESNAETIYPVWGYDENENDTPDILEDKFTLNFDESLGLDPITNILDGTIFDLTGLESPEHEDEDGVPVLFVGWSLIEVETILLSSIDDLPDLITEIEVDLTETDEETIYAVWGYDEDGDGVPDILAPGSEE